MGTRKCCRCGEDKPLNKQYYYPDKYKSSGYYYRCKICCKLERQTEDYKIKKRKWFRSWYLNNINKEKAHWRANYLEKIGKLKRDICNCCGSRNNLEKHHPDYNYPDNVIILCRNCHIGI